MKSAVQSKVKSSVSVKPVGNFQKPDFSSSQKHSRAGSAACCVADKRSLGYKLKGSLAIFRGKVTGRALGVSAKLAEHKNLLTKGAFSH